jgi:hypothetical protein
MRCVLFAFVVASLAGCRSMQAPTPLSGAETPEAVIEDTLRHIHLDLQQLEAEFPQLSGIQRATLQVAPGEKRFRFDYRQGFVKDDRLKGPTFEQDGCSLMVEMKYPAVADDAYSRPIEGRAIPIGNGKFVALWHMVRAESTEGGQSFVRKADEVISARLKSMEEALRRLR